MKRTTKDERVQVRLSTQDKRYLKACATHAGLNSVSEFVRKFAYEYGAKHGFSPPAESSAEDYSEGMCAR